MIDLTTNYLGLSLKNPIIVGSCSMTSSAEEIKQLEQYGAAAVVLKSIYEEEILQEAGHKILNDSQKNAAYSQLLETLRYIEKNTKIKSLSEYIKLIKDVKNKTRIPIIASVNCITDTEWIKYISQIEKAGANAIQLNVFLNPANFSGNDYEKATLLVIKKVLKEVTIPVSVKLGNTFTNLAQTIVKLSQSGISGIVLFSRFYSLDIDIYNLNITSGKMLSNADDYLQSLRWITHLSSKVDCSLAASTGIHHANTVIKQILAGADVVQIVSTLYLNGKKYIDQILSDMQKWMNDKGFFGVKHFKGKSSYNQTVDPAVFERIQFMKHFGRIRN